MRTVEIHSNIASKRFRFWKGLISRLPGMLVIGVIFYLFINDPLWPYHWMKHSWVTGFLRLISDEGYRNGWLTEYGGIVILLLIAIGTTLYALKVGFWNRIFKRLVLRYGEEGDLKERDIGRVYWIERWNWFRLYSRMLRRIIRGLKKLHIVDIMLYRPTDYLSQPRTIYYLREFRIINPFSPAKSMSRLISKVPDKSIEVQNSTTLTITGKFLDRKMEEYYTTFIISNEPQHTADIDVQHYRENFNDKMAESSITTMEASQMDSSMMKDNRKFQEVPVTCDRKILEEYKKAREEAKKNARPQ